MVPEARTHRQWVGVAKRTRSTATTEEGVMANKKAKKDKMPKKDKKAQSSKGAPATEQVVAQPPSPGGKKT
jgi:hypothetical protein